MPLWHDRGMVTKRKNISLGRSYLQGVWSDLNEDDGGRKTSIRNVPDRRLSVCHGGCGSKTETGRTPGRHDAANSDGLLGSLLVDSFVGAVFGPLLPLWAQGIDWSNLAEAIDTVWLDRRDSGWTPVPTPGISQVFVPL